MGTRGQMTTTRFLGPGEVQAQGLGSWVLEKVGAGALAPGCWRWKIRDRMSLGQAEGHRHARTDILFSLRVSGTGPDPLGAAAFLFHTLRWTPGGHPCSRSGAVPEVRGSQGWGFWLRT